MQDSQSKHLSNLNSVFNLLPTIFSIVDGKSGGCFGVSREGLPSPKIPNAGWDAVKGWDPASGWGTPRYDKLLKLAI
jgi:hypothetical protein